jgi:type IV pilus assembly protein PilY1
MREQRGTSMLKRHSRCLLALAALLMVGSVAAQTSYTDNFQGGTANLQWTALGDACLTAGTTSGTAGGNIPSCSSLNLTGGITDSKNQGALLLTTAQNDQTGAILSAFSPFPLSQGIQVTFTTYTFGGSADGLAKNGADGIVFILSDGTQTQPTATGGEGGSMGYGCSNGNGVYNGFAYGYLGLGIDEYGNFLNSGDNGSQGIYNSNDPSGTTANGTNSYYTSNGETISAGTGPQYQPERIGLRGAGNTNWTWLQAQNSSYYSGSSNETKVQAACKSGQYVSSGTSSSKNLKTITYNYNPIANGYAVLPNSEPIANNSKSATRNPAAGTTACVGNSPACTIAWPITYKLTISPTGLLNFAYSYNNGVFQPVLTNFNIETSNGPLPSSLRFGFSAGTGGSNNVHEITCFQASPLSSTSSAAANTIQSGEYKSGIQIYLAAYSNNNWWGSMQAVGLNTTNGVLSVDNVAIWDGKCVLTGGPCDTMGTNTSGTPVNSVTVEAPSARTLLTSSGTNVSSGGEPLEWGGTDSDANTSASGNISTAQQTTLNSTDSNGKIRLDWLRGDRTQEQGASSTAPLRLRTYVLGDIIDSSPTWVGAPNANYPNAFSDGLYGSKATVPENASGAQTYGTFTSNNATRLNVVYVGGNDGILHGFEAGYFGGTGAFSDPSSTGAGSNDGKEVIGYMPADVLANKVISLSNPNYVHDYMVDATPAVGDLFYNNTWHTWLVGGVGSTGKEIYALDVTNAGNPSGTGTPQGPSFSEANASTLVIGDWDSSNASLSHLGNSVGSPIITRMHNGDWAIIFGNGQGSGTSAGVYIGLVDPSKGTVTFQFLDTGVGSSSSVNGITYVTSVDLDGDNIADYLYAGDLQGNVWRFDVTSSTASNWAVTNFGSGKTATPLFVAKDASGNLQPITTAIVAAAIQTGGQPRALLYFGTGQETPQTATSGTTYDTTGTQTFYGIWDWNMNNWNTLSSVKYSTLTAPQSITRSNLEAQTSTETTASSGSVSGYRYLSNNTVCWDGSTACTPATSDTQFGWLYDLPDLDEQIIYNPTIIDGAVVVNTAIPPTISATQCKANQQTGWTMAFDAANGGNLSEGFFPGTPAASGEEMNGVGTPTALSYNGQVYLVSQTVTGTPTLARVNPPTNNSAARVSWREIRN